METVVLQLELWGDPDSLAAHIKRVRLERRISQERLSALIDASPSYVQQVESGRTLPNFIYAMRIAKALDVDPADLMLDVQSIERKD